MKHKGLLLICILAACIALTSVAWAQQSPPTDVQAAQGNLSAAVSFQAPAADSGSSITGYTVTSNPAGGIDSNAGSTSLIHVVTGLTNGTAYTFTVTATNSSNETSSASNASNSVTPSAKAYAALAGTWNLSAMMTGTDSPFGVQCVGTLTADGTFDNSCTNSYGSSFNSSCSEWLFPYGLTATCTPASSAPFSNFLCYGDSAGSVGVCSATLNDGSGSSYLYVEIKQGSGYTSSDLPGTWNAQDLDIDTTGDSWMQGNVSFSSNGNMSGSVTGSDGSTIPVSGAWSLSSDGLMSCTSGNCSGSNFYMDSGKNIAAGFGNFSTNNVQLMVLSKKASSYSLADLAGYWAGDELSSDGTWKRMTLQINGDGTFIGSVVKSDGSTSQSSGKLAISTTGVVTCASGNCSSGLSLVMDAGKNVMTRTATDNPGSGSPSYVLQILTKTSSLWPNAKGIGSGWEWLSWFGYFYTGDSPWIYNSTLGWLYPYSDSANDIWFYDPSMKAFWWTSEKVFPYVYRASDKAWLWYEKGTSNPCWFYNLNTGKWEKH